MITSNYKRGLEVIIINSLLLSAFLLSYLSPSSLLKNRPVFDSEREPISITDFEIKEQQSNHLAEIGFFDDNYASGIPKEITSQGEIIFITTHQEGLIIINASSPLVPRVIGTFKGDGDVQKFAIQGNYLYLCEIGGGLDIIDISNLSNQ